MRRWTVTDGYRLVYFHTASIYQHGINFNVRARLAPPTRSIKQHSTRLRTIWDFHFNVKQSRRWNIGRDENGALFTRTTGMFRMPSHDKRRVCWFVSWLFKMFSRYSEKLCRQRAPDVSRNMSSIWSFGYVAIFNNQHHHSERLRLPKQACSENKQSHI